MAYQIVKLRKLFSERSQRGFSAEEILAATQHAGVVPKSSLSFKTMESASEDYSNYKLVCVDDFVISLRSFEGGLEYSKCQGVISPAYTVLTPKNEAVPNYFKWFFKSSEFINGLSIHKKGIRDGQAIPWSALGEDFIEIPPPPTQTAIADYLDRKTAAIDALIATKEQLIEELRKYQEAVIAEAVAPREGWRKVRLKHLVSEKICTGVGEKGDRFEQGHPRYIRTSDIKTLTELHADNLRTLPPEVAAPATVKAGDILLTTAGSVGKLYMHTAREGEYCYAGFLARIRVRDSVHPAYIAYVLSSVTTQEAIHLNKVTSTIDNFSASKCAELELWLPEMKAQKAIAERLTHCLSELARLQEATLEMVGQLKKYRAAIISEAVSGKLSLDKVSH